MKKIIMPKLLTISIILLIFIVDLIVPSGTAIAILYIVPISISYTLRRKEIIIFAIATTILAAAKTAISSNSEINYSIFTDRVMSVLAIWLSCFIILRYKAIRERQDAEKENYLNSITEMLFKVSHEVRAPVCRMQGLTNLIDSENISEEDLKIISNSLKGSVTELDTFTKNLSAFLEKIQIENTKE